MGYKINWKLKEVLEERGMRASDLVVMQRKNGGNRKSSGVAGSATIYKMYRNAMPASTKLDTVIDIAHALNVDPRRLFEIVDDNGNVIRFDSQVNLSEDVSSESKKRLIA